VHSGASDKTKSTLGRIVNIWQEREAYDAAFLDELRQCITQDATGLRFDVPPAIATTTIDV
jgi:hypothetical protein